MEIATSKKLVLVLVPSLLLSVYYILVGELIEALLVLGVGVLIWFFLRRMAKERAPRRVDFNLITAVFHMYSLSLGETSPADLVGTIAENKEYGFYSSIFQKIRSLAVDFGYGFTKATALMAEKVKSPLKDFLVRCTNVFSSVEPKGYLEIESSTLMEEYSGYYTRAIETFKTLGGIFTAFQSVVVFLIMTLAIMAFFMVDPEVIIFGYMVAIIAVVLMYVLFRVASPKENVVYIGKHPHELYLGLKWSFLAFGPSSTVLAFFLYFAKGPSIAFFVLGLGVLIPGIFGYRLEKHIRKIDENYPTFLKSLGENLASTSDLKSAFSYLLHMELGPLKKLVKEALARLKLGISHRQTLESLSSEAASYQVHISNRILLDSLSRGADPLEIGKALGNRVVKFLEFRKKREVEAKSFQMIMMVMQPMTVLLLVILRVLAGFLNSSLVQLPYFGFNMIPIPIIEAGNIAVIFTMAVANALTLKEVSTGYWGTFFLTLGILLMVSGVTWVVAQVFIEGILGSMPSIELPT
jgi:archaellum biogenesis protein FlaJ (TadC family)